MPRSSLRLLSTGLILACVAAPAAAWTPETRMAMADEALRLMPRALRQALAPHRTALMRGLLAPLADEDAPSHRPPWSSGSLDAEVQARAEALAASLDGRTPFATVAERFGALAHFVQDAGFPPGATAAGAARFEHFSRFCESRRARFPLVFYGHDDAELERGDYRAYAVAVLQRARAEDGELDRAYAAAGDPPQPAAFDDRSIPFAVGSLAYSHSVTDVVRVWLHVWRAAGGDVGLTPYLDTNTKKKDS